MKDLSDIDIKYNVRHCLNYLKMMATVETVVEKGIDGYHDMIKSHVEDELHKAFEAGRKFERIVQ